MQKKLFVMIFIVLLIPTNVSATSDFSSGLKEGYKFYWDVETFIINETTIDNSDTYVIHQGSEIEVKVIGNPIEINLTDSLDISEYFTLTYDEETSVILNTIHEFTLEGMLTNSYLSFWDSFIYLVFPINAFGENRFDKALEQPKLGLTYVNMDSNSLTSLEEGIFGFHQVTDQYDLIMRYEYSSGVLQEGSLTTDTDEIAIVLTDTTTDDAPIYPAMVIFTMVAISILYRNKKSIFPNSSHS